MPYHVRRGVLQLLAHRLLGAQAPLTGIGVILALRLAVPCGAHLAAGAQVEMESKTVSRLSYDKVPKAINFRALAQKIQLKILELEDATSICQRDLASFNSIILS